ncbi:nhr-48 [Pristionchus pacificus]|uniref:Nhr-48 n=1 Tax=Pristionchus pacificus TaxID=54126 RepID=A0A2A6B5A7_PRIPA|nr:nhr-48 [Pristionchus pacificus]|eukprot:PDM61060.1 nhr-48 [Pristionchus pacificus]
MSTTLADVLYPNGTAAQPTVAGTEPQSPPSDLTPASPNGSSPGSDDDGTSRKRSASGSIKEGKERTANKICRVCGDKAYSYNFNVITCESCKAFFRRNANKEKEIRCPFNESCEINVVSRRFCQRCRLFKCFQVGMKKEWIMTDEARLEKKARVEENRERRREESKRSKDPTDSNGHNHYRTTSQSSGGEHRAPKGSSAAASAASAAAAAAATAAAAEQQTANFVQAHQHHYAQQQAQAQAHHQQQQQQAMFQPELPTLATSNATTNLLDAMVAAAAVQQQQQQQQQPFPAAAALPTAAALVAAVAAPPAPLPPTNTELMAHAIAMEQHLQQTPFGTATPSQQATAAAVYAVQQHQQQQQMAAAVQQIVSMTAAAPPPPLVDTMAAALALPATPQTTAAAILSAAGASPLGPLQQAALIMDATNAAATQQLLAAVPPPPSAVAAVATTMLLPPSMQPAAAPLPDRCRCTCNCGKYHSSRTIVDQAQEEWEADRRGRRSHSSSDELGLSELLPSNSTSVSWLNPSTNQNPLTEGALSIAVPTMNTDEAYPDFNQLTESFVKNPLHPSHPTTFIDPEFGPMQTDEEERLRFLHEANQVGAVKRMITMAKKFPALKALHETDQLKLIKSCYLDVMIIRGAMAYDPKENAWKGPSASHDYKIKMDAMNDESTDNMFQQSIRLYTMFKEEYRSDDAVMLLLNMIVLFDPNVDGLSNTASVRAEQNKYKLCLKRYMFTKLDNNQMKAQFEYKALLDRLATVRKMNSGARGIMEEHADSMDPLLKELLGKDDDHKVEKKKNHSPKAISSVSSSTSIDEPMSNSSRC